MRNFLITGHGRSGTKFLATIMNLSKKWTVLHEPKPHGLKVTLNEVQPLFNQEYYGEVNSFRRLLFSDIQVAKKGVLARDPYEIWVSIMNRSPSEVWPARLNRLEVSLQIISKAISNGARVIQFSKVTTNLDYLQEVLIDFGITDVDLKKSHLKPINHTAKKQMSIDDTPNNLYKKLKSFCDPFVEEHIQ